MGRRENKKIMSGNEAVVAGALYAGANFFAGYPITPSSEIMEEWSKISHGNKEIKFIQNEDEISAIHCCIGGSLAGNVSFTATSGPGFSLMQEGIGLAFAYRVPLVIVDSQRQGPSTGMPTMPAQGDILQTQYGSHGDYKTVVIYPNSVQECYDFTIIAFKIALKYGLIVILLMDASVSRMKEQVVLKKENKESKKQLKNTVFAPLGEGSIPRYFTGLVTENGIPSTRKTASYEKWIEEKMIGLGGFLKDKELNSEKRAFEFEGNLDAKELLIGFGIISRILSDLVREKPERYALLRVKTLFPIHEGMSKIINRFNKIILPEMNKGQYSKALRDVFLKDIKHMDISDIRRINL